MLLIGTAELTVTSPVMQTSSVEEGTLPPQLLELVQLPVPVNVFEQVTAGAVRPIEYSWAVARPGPPAFPPAIKNCPTGSSADP